MKLRKGFTLVELLIVIVIIGILAAAMLLASGAATASAEASNIVSNLRSLKSASLMFYADNMDILMNPASFAQAFTPTVSPAVPAVDIDPGGAGAVILLTQYTDNPQAAVWINYTFQTAGVGALASRTWWASAPVDRPDVRVRLASRAANIGLFSTAHTPASLPIVGDYTDQVTVYMLLRTAGS